MESTEFKPVFDEITRVQKAMREFLENHTERVPHDQDRIQVELPLFSNIADVISKKWATQVLWVLEIKKDITFNEISRFLEGISARSLSDTLKTLENHKMITRTVEKTRPPKVHYALSEIGKGFVELALLIIFYMNEDAIGERKTKS